MNVIRVLTTGSVDDGKSTLIGRLLYETDAIPEDRLALNLHSVDNEDKDKLKFPLFTDSLQVEREKEITVEVGYHFFYKGVRKYLLADSPGHLQYMHNMLSAATQTDIAIIVIDASREQSLTEQTINHSIIVSSVKVPKVIIAVNKMDLVNWDESIFRNIDSAYGELASKIGMDYTIIPISALLGENIETRHMVSWYDGPTLMDLLEPVKNHTDQLTILPIQYTTINKQKETILYGRLTGDKLRTEDVVLHLPSRKQIRIKDLYRYDERVSVVGNGDSCTVVLHGDHDIRRGDFLSLETTKIVNTRVIPNILHWVDSVPSNVNKQYLLQMGTMTAVVSIKETININEVKFLELYSDTEIDIVDYSDSRLLGSFILIDFENYQTIALGIVTLKIHGITRVPCDGEP